MSLTKPNQQLRRDLKESAALLKGGEDCAGEGWVGGVVFFDAQTAGAAFAKKA